MKLLNFHAWKLCTKAFLGVLVVASSSRLCAADTVVTSDSSSGPPTAAVHPTQPMQVAVAAQIQPVPQTTSKPASQPKPALSDREITQNILGDLIAAPDRRALVKKLKLHVTDGKVTVFGFVKDEGQAQEIVAIATKVAGVGNVEDKLQIKGKKRGI
jgi:hypothetical protein